MRRCICVIIALLSLTACAKQQALTSTISDVESTHSVTPQKEYTNAVYEVSILENLLHNDSVGNDWEKTYCCDGSRLTDGTRFTVPIGDNINKEIDIVIVENDKDKDIGACSTSINLTDGFVDIIEVIVTENKGRYCGRTAKWQIIFTVELVEYI